MKIKKEKYLAKNIERHALSPEPSEKYSIAVAVPAYAEDETLPGVLASLHANPPEMLAETAVVVIVNNPPREQTPPEKFASNVRTLESLHNAHRDFPSLNLFTIDASSPGLEIAPKHGVGGARRIAMDLCLKILDWQNDPLIISLDADTLVERNYLREIRRFFAVHNDCPAAAVHFEHQDGKNAAEDIAMVRHELLMRYYVAALTYAGSPYAYHAIGSAMTFRAEAYIAAGGMPRRSGGEDFYILQSLRKIGRVGLVSKTTVHPSSRPSDRVPFGTGPRLKEHIDGSIGDLVYNPEIFKELSELYKLLNGNWKILKDISLFKGYLPETLKDFLDRERFDSAWKSVASQTPGEKEKFILAFNTWFDALKTLRFVHFCETRKDKYPPVRNIEAFGKIACEPFKILGIKDEKSLLKHLRIQEKNVDAQ